MKQKVQKEKGFRLFLCLAAFLVTAAAIFTGGYVNDNEMVEVGGVAGKRYVAPRTIENRVATERVQQEALEEIGLLYKMDPEVKEQTEALVEGFFDDMNAAVAKLEAAEEAGEALNFGPDFVLQIPMAVTAEEMQAYYELTESGRAQFEKELLGILDRAYEERITAENLEKMRETVEMEVEDTLWQNALSRMGKDVLVAVLTPNLVVDEEAMAAAQEQKLAEVEPVMVLKGQKIVDEGEIVTEEIYTLLDDLGLVNISYAASLVPLVGGCGVVFLIFVAMYLFMTTQQQRLLQEKNKVVLIFCAYLLSLLFFSITSSLTTYYLVPVALFAMLTAILVRVKLAIILNLFVAVASLFIFNGSGDYLVYALLTGSFSALLIQYTTKRSRVFMAAVVTGFVHFLSYVMVLLFFQKAMTVEIMKEGALAGGVGFLLLLLVVGSLPLWEAIFGINSQYRLMELANPANELMRRLMIETPGTYHHSLIVANLAETAAYDIFCNGTLARVGAYYHDIGKLYKPQYFSENQFGENAHDQLDPYISAKMIIDHVEQGVELAKEHGIPPVIIDIIRQHHGTTLVKYFYVKSTKEKPEGETKEEDFRYKGPIPQFKESAIVMLADTVEAAVRSSLNQGKSASDVEALIDVLIKDKLNDGQLNDCRLDLKELDSIKQSFLKVFNGMNHNRVAYPKEEEVKRALAREEARKEEEK